MRWLRFAPVVGAALLVTGVWLAGPAGAQQGPDHLHLDLALAGCGTIQASGFELPKSTRLDLDIVNASTGRSLRKATVTTGAEGTLTFTGQVSLTGVKAVRMTVARAGAARPFAFSELTISGPCGLPFTGPARWPAGAGLALSLLLAGAVLVRLSAYRGRHLPGRAPR